MSAHDTPLHNCKYRRLRAPATNQDGPESREKNALNVDLHQEQQAENQHRPDLDYAFEFVPTPSATSAAPTDARPVPSQIQK